jgi:hypothetical protein
MSIKHISIFVSVLLFLGCSKKDNTVPDEKVLPPERVELELPQQNGVCVEGVVVSDSISTVAFKWKAAMNTDTYEVRIKNLLTKVVTSQRTTDTGIALPLMRNTPHSWWVVSRSSSNADTVQTSAWKFFNAGVAATAYAPFPAELLSPSERQYIDGAEQITLTWRTDDVDKDLMNYDIYFGTSPSELQVLQAGIPHLEDGSISQQVPVNRRTQYYWKIVSRDRKGNTAESEIASFEVN